MDSHIIALNQIAEDYDVPDASEMHVKLMEKVNRDVVLSTMDVDGLLEHLLHDSYNECYVDTVGIYLVQHGLIYIYGNPVSYRSIVAEHGKISRQEKVMMKGLGISSNRRYIDTEFQ